MGASRISSAIGVAFTILVIAALAVGNSPVHTEQGNAFYYNRLLGRGINLAGVLNAPTEGAWGITLKKEYFAIIKGAGFDSVRIPIRWSAHAAAFAPFTIDPEFLKRVDLAVDESLARNLVTIINVQDFDEMNESPDANLPRLVAIWKQISEHYSSRADRLYFEPLNEPHGNITAQQWSIIADKLIATIRRTNPTRIIVVGPVFWNNADYLDRLHLPESDKQIIVTFHYYEPMRFTHQGANWVQGSEAWKGTAWLGTAQEREVLRKNFVKVHDWAKKNDRPIYLGEFGAYEDGDFQSRLRWIEAVVDEARKNGFSWSYWQFCCNFAAYNVNLSAWHHSILKALLQHKSAK
jgi:endoglucanase